MKYVIGIDEVGRGALAGPVVVAAVAVPEDYNSYPKHLPKLRDSKRLSLGQRESWYSHILKNPQLLFASARIYQRGIEKLNISRSANLAASRALDKLLRQLGASELDIILDGGLYLGHKKHQDLRSRTIVYGDQRRNPIKLASIVAKVTRDRYLNTLDGRYPGYGLGRHKGYGTKRHFRAIQECGVLEIHRKTFIRN
jgi:ribonuclease HII